MVCEAVLLLVSVPDTRGDHNRALVVEDPVCMVLLLSSLAFQQEDKTVSLDQADTAVKVLFNVCNGYGKNNNIRELA